MIATPDTADLELSVQEAEDALALSQAQLDQPQAGPLEEAVAIAGAEHKRAQAQYESIGMNAEVEILTERQRWLS